MYWETKRFFVVWNGKKNTITPFFQGVVAERYCFKIKKNTFLDLSVYYTSNTGHTPKRYCVRMNDFNASFDDYDAMHDLACRTLHQMIIRADQSIHRNHMHIVCKSYAKIKIMYQELPGGSSESERMLVI